MFTDFERQVILEAMDDFASAVDFDQMGDEFQEAVTSIQRKLQS